MSETIIYARVSTEEQAKRGISIPHQIAECRKYSERHGFPVGLELTDDESGAHMERSGMDRLRELVRAGVVKRIIVWRQDRLARDELGYFTLRAEFRRHGVEIHAVNRGGKVDGLYASLEAVLDADERNRIRDRTAGGRMSKAKRGKIIGHGQPPYGYLRTGTRDEILWEIDEPRAAVVRRIYQWYTDELLSHAAIAARLTEQQIPSPSDRKQQIARKRPAASWNREMVRWILKNSTYAGVFYAYRIAQPLGEVSGKRAPAKVRPRDEWIPISVPAIVSQETWDAAQARAASAQSIGFGNARHPYLVARRVRCDCGLAMTGSTSSLSERNTKQYQYYSCNSRRRGKDKVGPPCPVPPFRADAVDDQVWQWVRETIFNPKALRRALGKREKRRSTTGPVVDERARLEAEHAELLARRDRLTRAYVADAMSLEEFTPIKKEIDAALLENERSRRILPQPTPSHAGAIVFAETLIEEYQEAIADAPFPLRRFIIDKFDIRVRLYLQEETKRIAVHSDALGIDGDFTLL